jgi:hypothetical protein
VRIYRNILAVSVDPSEAGRVRAESLYEIASSPGTKAIEMSISGNDGGAGAGVVKKCCG